MQRQAYLEEREQQDAEKQELQEIEALLDLLSETPLTHNPQLTTTEEGDQRSEHFGSDDGDELEYLMDRIMDDYDQHDTNTNDEEMDLT